MKIELEPDNINIFYDASSVSYRWNLVLTENSKKPYYNDIFIKIDSVNAKKIWAKLNEFFKEG